MTGASQFETATQLAADAERMTVDNDDIRLGAGDRVGEHPLADRDRRLERQRFVAVRTVAVLQQRWHHHEADPVVDQPLRLHHDTGHERDLGVRISREERCGHERVATHVAESEPIVGGEDVAGHALSIGALTSTTPSDVGLHTMRRMSAVHRADHHSWS